MFSMLNLALADPRPATMMKMAVVAAVFLDFYPGTRCFKDSIDGVLTSDESRHPCDGCLGQPGLDHGAAALAWRYGCRGACVVHRESARPDQLGAGGP